MDILIYLNVTRTNSWYDSYFSDRYTDSHLAGLFGYVSSSGYAVKNLNINATQILATHSGGIAYRLDAGTIENCQFTGAIGLAYYAGDISRSQYSVIRYSNPQKIRLNLLTKEVKSAT